MSIERVLSQNSRNYKLARREGERRALISGAYKGAPNMIVFSEEHTEVKLKYIKLIENDDPSLAWWVRHVRTTKDSPHVDIIAELMISKDYTLIDNKGTTYEYINKCEHTCLPDDVIAAIVQGLPYHPYEGLRDLEDDSLLTEEIKSDRLEYIPNSTIHHS